MRNNGKSIFNKLQEALVTSQEKWESDQQAQRKELNTKYNNDRQKVNNEYEEWFQTVAEGRNLEIEEKKRQCLAVFSEQEMSMISAVLDSGSGAEIEEYKKRIKRAQKESSVNYSKIYPVNLLPNRWTQALGTNFTFVDLLSSPDYISQELDNAQQELSNLQENLQFITDNKIGDVQQAAKAYTKAYNDYNNAQSDLTKTLSNNSITALKIYFANSTSEENPEGSEQQEFQAVTKLAEDIESGKGKQDPKDEKVGPISEKDWEAIQQGQSDLIDKQQALSQTAQAVADASLNYITAQGTSVNTDHTVSRIKQTSQKITQLTKELAVASKKYFNQDGKSSGTTYDESGLFETITINFSSSTLNDKTNLVASASQTSWDVDLFFGSASGSSSKSSSDFASQHVSKDESIEIACLATKVTIDRGWFEPSIFNLTGDMQSVRSEKISLGTPNQNDLQNPSTLEKYNNTIFPAYPVAFVIAKDISINFKINTSSVDAANKMVQSKSNEGGGFLCFSASHSQSSDNESKSLSSNIMGESVSIKIPGSQIIGWYLEYTPEDQSTPVEPGSLDNVDQFIKAFKDVQVS